MMRLLLRLLPSLLRTAEDAAAAAAARLFVTVVGNVASSSSAAADDADDDDDCISDDGDRRLTYADESIGSFTYPDCYPSTSDSAAMLLPPSMLIYTP